MSLLFIYKMFCKGCQKDVEFELKLEQDITGLGDIMLNCHYCNDYSIFVGQNRIGERFRDGYFTHTPKKIIKQKPIFSFLKKFKEDKA